jgi:hypothetical protein
VPGARELWSSGAPLKYKLHMWLAMKDRLWTDDRLERRGLEHQQFCPLCCQEAETVEHLTLQCSHSRQVWFGLLNAVNLSQHTPTADATIATWWLALSNAVPAKLRKELNSLVVLVARELWLERNARIANKFATVPCEICRRIKHRV